MLENDAARELYHEHAARMPIIDYHCHLVPQMIAENRRFGNITEAWLGGDHYQVACKAANGVEEAYITGDKSDWEKFEKWAGTLPYAMRNPLYHWTHLELARIFGIDEVLSPRTAREIYEACNARLAEPGFRAQGLMTRVMSRWSVRPTIRSIRSSITAVSPKVVSGPKSCLPGGPTRQRRFPTPKPITLTWTGSKPLPI